MIMFKTFLHAKIHRAAVTETDLDYEGSLGVDEDLMEAAGLQAFERVEVFNITNGERFATYLIAKERGSRTIGVYGAAARRAKVGDLLIVVAYAILADNEIEGFAPRVVTLNGNNEIISAV